MNCGGEPFRRNVSTGGVFSEIKQDCDMAVRLILYSKPGCHLCEGLQEKLEHIHTTQTLEFDLEIRDITTRDDWFNAYQYEIPVLFVVDDASEQLTPIPRPSPRISIAQLAQTLQKYVQSDPSQ
jgi:hypothetical protein